MHKGSNRPRHVTTAGVFDDLGFSKERATALKIKAEILAAILRHVEKQRYRQADLVRILGEKQPRVSNLLNGKISQTSIEKLLTYLQRLGADASIRIRMPKTVRAA